MIVTLINSNKRNLVDFLFINSLKLVDTINS